MKITEVPSYEENRISGQSNLNTIRDGFRVLGTILEESHRRRTIDRGQGHPEPEAEPAQKKAVAAA